MMIKPIKFGLYLGLLESLILWLIHRRQRRMEDSASASGDSSFAASPPVASEFLEDEESSVEFGSGGWSVVVLH